MTPAQALNELFTTPRRHIPRPSRPPKLAVTLNVQKGGIGHRYHVTYTFSTISRLDAELQAYRKAREDGLKVWWVFDIEEVTHGN